MTTPRGIPKLRWAPSPGSPTSERGWAGRRQLFSIIDRGYELALHTRLPDVNGLPLQEQTFPVGERERAQGRAQEIWEDFMRDVLSTRVSAMRDQSQAS